MEKKPVAAVVETMTIPTYPSPEREEMPMFAEYRNHQGTTGNPYPNRVTIRIDRENRADKDYEVVRLENEYLRLIIIPSLGGRVFEAYDKTTGYDFLYRQHVIKPALIGALGSWISGGLEFNWPFHHRPSTFMPVDYSIEREDDGTAIVWLSEADPTERTKGMVGIVLHPGEAFFETRAKVTNRTPLKHSFLWWENGAVPVNEQYQLFFPPDVTYARHHYRRSRVTFPITTGEYGGVYFDEPTDISMHKNSIQATSYFSAASKYDFFGGFDHGVKAGVIHVADHHTSPGKKMFTWGYSAMSKSWEKALTDTDGAYAELMASSYSDNQPDFTWIEPYETKNFSEYWYPIADMGVVTFATLYAAVTVDAKAGFVKLQTTKAFENAVLKVTKGDKTLFEKTISTAPGQVSEFTFDGCDCDCKMHVTLTKCCGETELDYSEETPDELHMPSNFPGIASPSMMKTAQELYIAGLHIDQFRDPTITPDTYYKEALKRDPEYLPALTAMGQYCYRTAHFNCALKYLEKANAVQTRYNINPIDGTIGYLLGLTLLALGRTDCAYNAFRKSAWCGSSVEKAMTFAAAIDGARGNYKAMKECAEAAVAKEAEHPIAGVYAALAAWKLGCDCAAKRLDAMLARDPLNHLARYAKLIVTGAPAAEFFPSLRSDISQTVLDVTYNLNAAGFYCESAALMEAVETPTTPMLNYTLAFTYAKMGKCGEEIAKKASECAETYVYPYRLEEIQVLRFILEKNPADATAESLLACVLYDKHHHEEAASLWQSAIKNRPDCYMNYRNLAVAYYSHLGRSDEALELMKKAVQLNPHDQQLLYETSLVMTRKGICGCERAKFLVEHMPDGKLRDDLALEIVKAYNQCGNYDAALEVMMKQAFVPCEGGEHAVASQYMFNKFAQGRKALAAEDNEKALELFRDSQSLPPCLGAGLWNLDILVPYRYFEALALSKLGKKDEAHEICKSILKHSSAGGEFMYYYAMCAEMLGDHLSARNFMHNGLMGWEAALDDEDCGWFGATAFFISFCDDPKKLREGTFKYLIGLAKLYTGENCAAKKCFEESLAADPDNLSCALELELLK